MSIIRMTAIASAAAVGLSLVAAPQASAYDRDAYEYAAGHMIDTGDIPKTLGTFLPAANFYAAPGFPSQICYIPGADADNAGLTVNGPKSTHLFTVGYSTKPTTGPLVSVSVMQFTSAQAAIRAFGTLKKRVARCVGTGVTSYTDEDGYTSTYSTQVSNAKVPGVAVVGVPSLSVTQDNLSESDAPDESSYINDSYSVYSLVNDVIINTDYFVNGAKNLTTAQRKAVNQVAFNAITEWLD